MIRRLAQGGIAGLLATVVMSTIIVARELLEPRLRPAPAKITFGVARSVGLRPARHDSPVQAGWIGAHLMYGSFWGIAYGLVRPLMPAFPTPLAGLAWGALVWAANYLGLMPRLHLYPWPSQDAPIRRTSVILAHGVYGPALSMFERWMRG